MCNQNILVLPWICTESLYDFVTLGHSLHGFDCDCVNSNKFVDEKTLYMFSETTAT